MIYIPEKHVKSNHSKVHHCRMKEVEGAGTYALVGG